MNENYNTVERAGKPAGPNGPQTPRPLWGGRRALRPQESAAARVARSGPPAGLRRRGPAHKPSSSVGGSGAGGRGAFLTPRGWRGLMGRGPPRVDFSHPIFKTSAVPPGRTPWGACPRGRGRVGLPLPRPIRGSGQPGRRHLSSVRAGSELGLGDGLPR